MAIPVAPQSGLSPHGRLTATILKTRLTYGRRLRPYLVRRPVQWVLDGLCGAFAMLAAYLLRYDMSVPVWVRPAMWTWLAIAAVVTPLAVGVGGGYRSTWQHFGMQDFLALLGRLFTVLACVLFATVVGPRIHLLSYGISIIDFVLAVSLLSTMRMLRRLDHEALLRLSATERILVIGTGLSVAAALRQLQPLYGGCVVGTVTDDAALQGAKVGGVRVLGRIDQLGQLIYAHDVTLLFLSSSDLRAMPQVMETAAEMDVAVKLLPSVHDVVSNRVRVSKNVTVSALRKFGGDLQTELHPDVLACLEGRTVLVTGAAGSIGSELVRQVAQAPVRRLLLLDQDENGIFELLHHQLGNRENFVPVIADIRDTEAIGSLFARERPQVILHAAAYKHVPLMEQNPAEAVLNNVLGTRTLAEAAIEYAAERMVMISSDKAVNPSSIMGASKRLAEVVIQDLAVRSSAQGCATAFSCVRFGNVLGSRGSVLPLFLKQIEQGGPITVTHEQMTRYFMTIPQAVSLVLRAATLASCGHIYMLDMGDPVRIVNFAREVIRLAGLTPDKDIEVKIVGSRPGEKLHEQLWSEDAEVAPTSFEQVFEVKAETPGKDFAMLLTHLEHAAREHQPDEVRSILQQMPISYLTEKSKRLDPLTV